MTVLLVEQKLPFARRCEPVLYSWKKARAWLAGTIETLTDEVVTPISACERRASPAAEPSTLRP